MALMPGAEGPPMTGVRAQHPIYRGSGLYYYEVEVGAISRKPQGLSAEAVALADIVYAAPCFALLSSY